MKSRMSASDRRPWIQMLWSLTPLDTGSRGPVREGLRATRSKVTRTGCRSGLRECHASRLRLNSAVKLWGFRSSAERAAARSALSRSTEASSIVFSLSLIPSGTWTSSSVGAVATTVAVVPAVVGTGNTIAAVVAAAAAGVGADAVAAAGDEPAATAAAGAVDV